MLVSNRIAHALAQPTPKTATKRHVLVPVDGSPVSQEVLSAVRAFDPDRVTALHVAPAGSRSEVAHGALVEGLSPMTRVLTLVREGSPAEAIVEVAGDHGVGLVAMATRGRSGLSGWLRPSVTEKVIGESPVPVLAVRANPDTTSGAADRLFDRVLVPHDGSRAGSRAIDGLALLVDPTRVRLTIFGVVPAYGPAEPPARRADRENVVERILGQQAGDLRRKLERVAARARGLGFKADVQVDIGDPTERVLDRARSLGVTLVAVGDRERSKLSRLFLGSTAQRILRAAEVPVLVCP